MDQKTILGLTTNKQFTDEAFHTANFRRQIAHDYPTGPAPLTALLSLMETEETDSSDFGWHEKRYVEPRSLLEHGAGGDTDVGIFFDTDEDTREANNFDVVAGDVHVVRVADSSEFRINQVIRFLDLKATDTSISGTLQGNVSTIISATLIRITCLNAVTNINNDGVINEGVAVTVIGNAVSEGSNTQTGRIITPCSPRNFTQIFRNSFSFTRTALAQPTDFDDTGLYQEKMKDTSLDHMTEMEKAFLWQDRYQDSVVLNGESLQRNHTGGILWYLKQWEAANSLYRGGAGAPAITGNGDDDKRILDINGAMTIDAFESYIERVFRQTSNKADEKLCLCGSGFLTAINNVLKDSSTLNRNFTAEQAYGMNMLSWETPHGTIHFKKHPLMSRTVDNRYDAFMLDIQNLKFRPLNGGDTQLLKNRQDNGFDGRTDEFLTEAGLEVMLPESNMYIRNATSITS